MTPEEELKLLRAILLDITFVAYDDVVWSGQYEATDLAIAHPYLIELHKQHNEVQDESRTET